MTSGIVSAAVDSQLDAKGWMISEVILLKLPQTIMRTIFIRVARAHLVVCEQLAS